MDANKLPSALEKLDDIFGRFQEGRPAIFLDYDGTLTPIVDDPSQALLPETTRQLIRKLAEHWVVAIMSGRSVSDVKDLLGLENLFYAGSHGFSMIGPEESFHEEPGEPFLPALDQAEVELKTAARDLPGVHIERKQFAIAIHYRQAEDQIVPELEERVSDIANRFTDLKQTSGKKIFELRPNADWDKGKALLYLLKKFHIDSSRTIPLYIGDDTTDEDAFRAIADRGIGILVSDTNRETAAGYRLRDPAETAEFLEKLVAVAEKEPSTNVWSLVYEGFEPDKEQLREALCTLGNGRFAARGAASESVADGIHYPGTYIAGVYNRLNSNVDGEIIENESMVNVANWLSLTFRIGNDEWFDLESVNILDYRQELDMARGVLVRTVRFEDKKNRRTRFTQRRFVHMSEPHLAGLETAILPENWSGPIQVRSALDGRVENSLVKRYQSLESRHLRQIENGVTGDQLIWLLVETNQSCVRIAESARTKIFFDGTAIDAPHRLLQEEGYIAQEFDLNLREKQAVRIEKIISIYNSKDSAISESLIESQEELRCAGSFAELLERHVLAWTHLWEHWRINVEAASPRIEQILNLHIFHLLQTVSPNTVDLDVGVPPRGLHGEAYRGLIMWDELFIFPLLNLRIPDITRSLLMYRYRRLHRATGAADQEGYDGALFPWQSGSNGQEQAQVLHINPTSGRWLADNSHLEQHINIAVAYNIWQYYQVSGDRAFIYYYGAELIIEIARFWASKAKYNQALDRYEIRKVMGPDEFHDGYPGASEPGIDNNAYTNVMVAWIFRQVLEMLDMLPEDRRKSVIEDQNLKQEELDKWDEIGRKLRIVFHDGGIISQFEGYGDLKEFDWQKYRRKYGNIQRLDRILEAEGDSTNSYKLSKQADVLMLFYLLSADELGELFSRLGYAFERETIPKNIEYYLKRTSYGSTLSRVVNAWVLSRSQREASWHLFQDALESDIDDIQGGTTSEGIHLGAMAGTVDLVMRCYSGVESRGDILWFNPSLPSELDAIKFELRYRGHWIDVSIGRSRIILRSRPGPEPPVKIGITDRISSLASGAMKEFELGVK